MILYRKCFKSGQQRHCHIEFSLLVFQTQVMQNLSSIDRVNVDDALLITLRYICKFLLSLRSFQSIVVWVPRRRIFVVNPDVVDLKDQNLHYEIFGTTFYSIFIQNGANHFRFNSIFKKLKCEKNAVPQLLIDRHRVYYCEIILSASPTYRHKTHNKHLRISGTHLQTIKRQETVLKWSYNKSWNVKIPN